jgi:glyoxylase-like metal-dependent hydrolase (beta-lactamase superfamily II)
MIFKQFRYERLFQASYLLGCPRAREGFVVDPIADLGSDFYVLEAADQGLDIVGVLETHVHADFVSCARELAEMTGGPHYLHEAAKGLVRYEFTPFADGQTLTVGQVDVRALHTPGHTPEHTCFLVTDRARANEPWAVLTGDSLFVGDVGRPDLLVGDQALDVYGEEERAALQFRSIREKLFTLPDHVEVFPNHYGGSTCGGVNMSGKASSTISFEKRFNLALAQPDAAAFASFVRETAKPFPEHYQWIKSYNLGLITKDELEGAMRT